MRFFKFCDDTVEEVPARTLQAEQKPFYFFLGGLLHLNGLELAGGLPVLLRTLTQGRYPIYTAIFNETPNIAKTANQMYDYHNSRSNTQEAEEIVSQLFITPETGLLTSAFQQVRFIGYSYGTSLIQQIEAVLRDKLGLGANKALENVRCLNIGPVITPNVTTSLGHVLPFNRNMIASGTGIDPSGRFKQAFIFRTSDKVMGDVIGDALLDKKDRQPHITFETPHLVFLAEKAGDAFIRRIGIGRYASGNTTPRLDYTLDFEGHSLRLYTNELSVTESNKGRFAVFPSSSCGPLIKNIITAMDDNSLSWSQLATQWVTDGGASATHLKRLHSYFNNVAGTFQARQFAQSIPYVEGVLKRVSVITATTCSHVCENRSTATPEILPGQKL